MSDERPIQGQCSDCRFYFDKETPETVGCGECRFGPPTALPIFERGAYHMAAFPLVSEYGWCWKFTQKEYR